MHSVETSLSVAHQFAWLRQNKDVGYGTICVYNHTCSTSVVSVVHPPEHALWPEPYLAPAGSPEALPANTQHTTYKWLVLKATVLHCKAILGWGQLKLMEWIFVLNHVPGAGSIAWPVDQQSSVLSLYHGCLLGISITKQEPCLHTSSDSGCFICQGCPSPV